MMQRKGVPSLPFLAYISGFVLLAIILYSLTAWWMQSQMQRVSQLAEQSRQVSASEEMKKAIKQVMLVSERLAVQLSLWDETHQQLFDSTYYEYWRETRIRETSHVPAFVSRAEIYDREGRNLYPHPGEMPQNLPQTLSYLRTDGTGKPYLYYFHPISSRNASEEIIGHIGVRLDFMVTLRDMNRMLHVDSESIQLELEKNLSISIPEITRYMHYQTLDFADTSQLEALMRSSSYRFGLVGVMLALFAAFMIIWLMNKPLKRMTHYIDARRSGDTVHQQIRLKGRIWVRELEILADSLLRYQRELEDTNSHLDQSNKELWRLAHYDSLTGIPNRRAYEEHWRELQTVLAHQRINLTVMLIDCDHFKAINDNYGHDVGDEVIRKIADALNRALRDGDRLFRIGGDEFAVHLLNTDQEQAGKLARRFHENLRQVDFGPLGIREQVSFSIGMACASGQHPDELASLHKQADTAMYQAKRPGSSKVVVFHDALVSSDGFPYHSRFVQAVYRAVENGDGIRLHFQPVLAAQQGGRCYYEILCRLQDEHGLIMPNDIFTVVDREGLAVEFDYALLDHLQRLLERNELSLEHDLAINLDGRTLLHDEVVSRLTRLEPYLRRQDKTLILEIGEEAMVAAMRQGGIQLQTLRDMGYVIALDNFGGDASPLHYMTEMPVDIIKLDKRLVQQLDQGGVAGMLGEHLTRMIQHAGYYLVAAGVESEKQLQQVLNLQFGSVQGYLFGVPEAEIDTVQSLSVANYDRFGNSPD